MILNDLSHVSVHDDDITTVFECEDFIVIEKPQGLAVHNDEASLGLISKLRELNPGNDVYPVHRLDQATSGLMVLAKNKAANRDLSMQFEQRRVSKLYWAVADKKPLKKQGCIAGDMKRSRNGSWMLCRSHENPAITHFFSFALGDGVRAFLLKPYTGKTHQLRVALKSLAAPILGDVRYGGSRSDRMHLHATELSFNLNDQAYTFNSCPKSGEQFMSPAFRNLYAQEDILGVKKWPRDAVS